MSGSFERQAYQGQCVDVADDAVGAELAAGQAPVEEHDGGGGIALAGAGGSG
ncbi:MULTISPECIES: hypothetical protein [unclassified Streptomyces]|uniref:hypothetical protein n=1 Tax=unclassified Streptomyces TaxID=2593676 RepID=UPI003409BE98